MFKIENGKPKYLTNNLIEIVEWKQFEERALHARLHPDKIPHEFARLHPDKIPHDFP
jgi:hypothetical protein